MGPNGVRNVSVLFGLVGLGWYWCWYSLHRRGKRRRRRRRFVIASTWNHGRIAVEGGAGAGRIDALDAVVEGVNAVELDLNGQYFVGHGGLPNAEGIMELDAAVMDGTTSRFGAVMALQKCRSAVRVARCVMDDSAHNCFVGEGAGAFARRFGFAEEDVLTEEARREWEEWVTARDNNVKGAGLSSHDTVGAVAIDANGRVAAATSTSGWKFCSPGRVGDSPLVGSGLFASDQAGAAVATGDGEEIMRCCLSFVVVEAMRNGKSPQSACEFGISRMRSMLAGDSVASQSGGAHRGSEGGDHQHPRLTVAVLAINLEGEVGAATTIGENNWHEGTTTFPYFVFDGERPTAGAQLRTATDVK